MIKNGHELIMLKKERKKERKKQIFSSLFLKN